MIKSLPFALILFLTTLAYFLNLNHLISFEALQMHHKELYEFTQTRPVLSSFLFILCSIFKTTLLVPGREFITLLGGFLFPFPLALFYTSFACLLGTFLLFISLCSFLRLSFFNRFLFLKAKDIEIDWASMLFLRLIPFFPFWISSLLPAFFKVRLWDYLWTTFVGTFPFIYLLSKNGSELNAYFETEKNISTLLSLPASYEWTLTFCAGVSLVCLFVKKRKKKKSLS